MAFSWETVQIHEMQSDKWNMFKYLTTFSKNIFALFVIIITLYREYKEKFSYI